MVIKMPIKMGPVIIGCGYFHNNDYNTEGNLDKTIISQIEYPLIESERSEANTLL